MYCTINDIINSIGKNDLINFTNDENRSSADIDFTNPEDLCSICTEEMILAAKDEIDPYLEPLGVLPFASADVVPNMVKNIAIRITIKNLYERRFRNEMPDSILADYKVQRDNLEKISNKKLKLPGADGAIEETAKAKMQVNKTEADRIFSNDFFARF